MNRLFSLAAGVCCLVVVGFTAAHHMGVISRIQNPAESKSDKLNTLAYISEFSISLAESQLVGVTKFERSRTADGINVYVTIGADHAQLLDMRGNSVHVLTDKRESCSGGWEFAKPYVDGQFLVLAMGTCSPLFVIDWQSNVVWESDLSYHHDASFDANGDIYALARELVHDDRISPLELLDDQLVVLAPDGHIKKQLSFADMFAKDPRLLRLIHSEEDKEVNEGSDPGSTAWDVFHSNTLEVLRQDVICGNGDGILKAGNVLFCCRHLDLIGAIDVQAERVVWYWGAGKLDSPHGPALLDNGHILVLDNGKYRGKSRIVEMDPASGRIVSTIGDDPRSAFFTAANGGLQRLPNGNTLITESQRGRVFEVTPDGSVVWEFFSTPYRDETWKRPVVYRMPRIVDYKSFPKLQSNLTSVSGLSRTISVAEH